jgi:O-acetylserine/cysteine efflux transporter
MGRPTWAALRPDLQALCAVASFALSYALTKVALEEWHPLAFMGSRFVAMAAIALVVLGVQRRFGVVFGPDLPRFALGGLFGFTLYQLGFVLGLDRTSAFSSTLLLTTIPLCSLVFLRIGGVEPVEPAQWGGVGLAAVGIALFIWAEEGGPRLADARLGDLLSLGAAASFALYGIVGKPLGARYPASTVLAGTLLLGSVPLLPLSLVAAPARSGSAISAGGWLIWAYSAVVPVYLGYTWWTAAIAARGVAAIAPYTLLVPVLGGLLAVGGLGERLTGAKLLGAALTLAGLALGRGWIPVVRRERSR